MVSLRLLQNISFQPFCERAAEENVMKLVINDGSPCTPHSGTIAVSMEHRLLWMTTSVTHYDTTFIAHAPTEPRIVHYNDSLYGISNFQIVL